MVDNISLVLVNTIYLYITAYITTYMSLLQSTIYIYFNYMFSYLRLFICSDLFILIICSVLLNYL